MFLNKVCSLNSWQEEEAGTYRTKLDSFIKKFHSHYLIMCNMNAQYVGKDSAVGSVPFRCAGKTSQNATAVSILTGRWRHLCSDAVMFSRPADVFSGSVSVGSGGSRLISGQRLVGSMKTGLHSPVAGESFASWQLFFSAKTLWHVTLRPSHIPGALIRLQDTFMWVYGLILRISVCGMCD